MRSEEIYALAVEISQEGLRGTGGQDLGADDIYPVLLALFDRGVALRPPALRQAAIGMVASISSKNIGSNRS